MVAMGLDPNNESLDPTTPEGIGNLAAKMVIETRKGDEILWRHSQII